MGRRLALLIGISRFDDRGIHPLNAPEADVRAFDAVLRDPEICGFDSVDLCLDEPYESVRNKITRLTRNRESDDLILLYYSGHGVLEFPAELHLLTRNTMLDNLEAASFSANEIRDFLKRSRSRRQILILDCCYAGAYAADGKKVGAQPAVTQETFDPEGYGRVVMLATSEAQSAPDAPAGSGQPSPYTRMIVEALRSGLPADDGDAVSAQALAAHVESRARRDGLGIAPRHILDTQAGPLVLVPRARRKSSAAAEHPTGVPEAAVALTRTENTVALSGPRPGVPTPPEAAAAAAAAAKREAAPANAAGPGLRETASPFRDSVAPPSPGNDLTQPIQRPRRSPLGPAAAAIVLGVAGAAGLMLFELPGKFVPSPQPQVSPSPLPSPDPVTPAPRPFPVGIGEHFRDCPECPEMVVIPAGTFTMGSPANEEGRDADEGPQRQVTLRSPLAVGRHPVTVAQYRAFVTATGLGDGGSCWTWTAAGRWEEQRGLSWRSPGFAQGDDHPVVCVSWEDAQAYARWVSQTTGQRYRLLTEAEWEYAARAGTRTRRTRWWWGEREADQCRHANGADQTARSQVPGASGWTVVPCSDGFAYTSPVGRFAENRFGLHDMGGNVWQWMEDCYRDSYEGAPGDASVAVTTRNCSARVLRGGSWYNSPQYLRAANRNGTSTGNRGSGTGFRLARTPGG